MGQWADWGETKRKHIEWILGWLCDLHLSPHPPLDLGFSRSTFEEAVYPKGRVTWYGSNSKGMRVQWCTFATSLWLTRGSSSPVGHRDIGDNMGLCSPLNTDGAVDVLAPNVFYHSIKCDNFCQAIFSQSENNYSQFWPISIQLQQPMKVEGIGNVATWLVQNEPFWLVHVWVWNNGVDYKTRLWRAVPVFLENGISTFVFVEWIKTMLWFLFWQCGLVYATYLCLYAEFEFWPHPYACPLPIGQIFKNLYIKMGRLINMERKKDVSSGFVFTKSPNRKWLGKCWKGLGKYIPDPVSNLCTSDLFGVNQTNHSWDMVNRVFHLEKTGWVDGMPRTEVTR